jgi:tetratricopeptide (TPR) repeat protein
LLRLQNGRYDMHPMLSHFATEKLTLTANAQDAYSRHARFYLDFLAGQANGETTEQRQAIQMELANVRAAWQWAAAQQDYQAILEAAPILHSFYSVQSWFHQGIDAFRDALAQLSTVTVDFPEAAGIPLLAQTRCELLGRSARMQIHIGQLDTANRALDEALREARFIEDPGRLSTILGYTAISAFYAGDLQRAIALAEESLTLDESSDDLDGVAFALNFLGSCHKSRGDYAAASQYFTRSVALYDEMKDDLGRAMSLNNLGNLAQAQGEYAAAHDYYLQCSHLFGEQNHVHGAATTLANAGRLSRKMGNLVEARTLLQESLTLKRSIHDDRGVAVALIGLADVAVAAGDSSDARAYLCEALPLAYNAGDVKLTLEGLAIGGVLRHQESADPMPGARLLAFVMAHPALAQEVRDQVQKVRSAITAKIWESATDWATGQTLATLVNVAVTEG